MNLNISAVYAIKNAANGKLYVGSAVDVQKRWREHKRTLALGRHHNKHLQRAYNKDGIASFEYVVLEPVANASDLLSREQHWIDAHNSSAPSTGYNICSKAGSVLGLKHTEQSRRRMSLARAGKPGPVFTEEQLGKMAAAKIGFRHSIESKLKMSASAKARKKRTVSPEIKSLIRLAVLGELHFVGFLKEKVNV